MTIDEFHQDYFSPECLVGVFNERDRLLAENQELKDMEQCSHELFEAACNDLGDAQEKLDALRDVIRATCFHSDPSEYFHGMNKCYDILFPDTGAPEVMG